MSAKSKIMNLHVINDNTRKWGGKNPIGWYIAFDFEPDNKRKPMVGVIVKDRKTALALAQAFTDMAELMK